MSRRPIEIDDTDESGRVLPARAPRLRAGARVAAEREIEILSMEWRPTNRTGSVPAHLHVTARSDSGREYVLRLRKAPEESSCSCPSWIFRGARLAEARGLSAGQRAPCVHLRTIFATAGPDILNQGSATPTAASLPREAQRFRLLELED